MSTEPPSRTAENGFLLAWILTGCEEGARAVLPEAAKEAARHPAAHDRERREKLFFAAVCRRSLKFPARCELAGKLAELHAALEPGRTLLAFEALGVLPAKEAATIVGIDPRQAAAQADSCSAQVASATQLREELSGLRLSPESEAVLAVARCDIEGAWKHGTAILRNPATIAVGVGFLLLVGLIVWNVTGRGGAFPEDAVKIATEAAKAKAEEFTALNIKAADLPDWLAMKGYPEMAIPASLGSFEAVGLRTFRFEGEMVAQIAVLDGERRMFFTAFPGRPLGIHLSEGVWKTASAGAYALAIRQDGPTCFLVQFKGTPEEMASFLRSAGDRGEVLK